LAPGDLRFLEKIGFCHNIDSFREKVWTKGEKYYAGSSGDDGGEN
jgi:hypothetical protein